MRHELTFMPTSHLHQLKIFSKKGKKRKKNQHQEKGCFLKNLLLCVMLFSSISMKRKEKAVSECEKLGKKALNEPQIFII